MVDDQRRSATDGLAPEQPDRSGHETDHRDNGVVEHVVVAAPVAATQQRPRRLRPTETALVTLWLIVVTGTAILALLSLWPVAEQVRQTALATAGSGTTGATGSTGSPGATSLTTTQLHLPFAQPALTPDVSIILIGMLSGVLGSLVHTLTWLNQSSRDPTTTGRKKAHRTRDVVWFVTAPIQGALLAFLVICAGAAGLLSAGQAQATSTVSLFTVAAVGGLTGLFSRRMTAKLAQIVNQVAPRTSTPQPMAHGPTTATATATPTETAKPNEH